MTDRQVCVKKKGIFMRYKLIDLIDEVLEKAEQPLSPKEIWETAVENGLDKKLNAYGKTPDASIGARLYTSTKDNPKSPYKRTGKRPERFYLKSKDFIAETDTKDYVENLGTKAKPEKNYSERALHKLLATYVFGDQHFKCRTKTIYHEKSKREEKGKNKWLHPDMVGIYYPFGEYENETLELYSVVEENPYKIFSFELKKEIDFSNIRECYFQAVSNSSWASEGYLVVGKMNEDAEFIDELRRLNNAFGIGVIKLEPENISQSEIVFRAESRHNLDWDTINTLIRENADFKQFIKDIKLDSSDTDERLRGKYDDVFEDDDDAREYAVKNGILTGKEQTL